MAWPYDARHHVAAPNNPAPSATWNEIQDRIIDLFEDHRLVDVHASWGEDASNNPGWVYDVANPEQGYRPGPALTPPQLVFHLRARQSCVLWAVEMKYYNGHPTTASSNRLDLYKADLNFDTPASAPALGAALATVNPTNIPATTWGVVSMSGLGGGAGIALAVDERLLLVLNSWMDGTNDRVAGVQPFVRPLTAT